MTIEKQVITAIEAMTAAFHAGDIERVMASYEQQATIMFEPGVPVSDREAQRQAFQQAFAINPQFSYADHAVFGAGDTALHIAPWTMTGTAPDGNSVRQEGLSVAVLKRQDDGSWLIAIDDPHGQTLLKQDG